MNIGLISHRTGNIGHAFMATGVEAIVRYVSGIHPIEITHIEQHRPLSIYPRWHPIRLLDHLQSGRLVGAKRWAARAAKVQRLWRKCASFVDRFDLVIDCGGPNIAPNVAFAPEMQLQFPHLFGAFASRGVPVVSLSNGSCYPLEAVPERIPNAEDEHFLRDTLKYVRVATVRDRVAATLCAAAGHALPLIPCPALLADAVMGDGDYRGAPGDDGYVLVNFQAHGANSDWGQGVDHVAWNATMQQLILRLQRRHRVAFMCHNEREYRLAAPFGASLPRFLPATVAEYYRVIARAKVGLCNRIHAAIPLASIGVSSVGVGTDSRLGTLELMGLPTVYVKHATVDLLEHELERLLAIRRTEAERLQALKRTTFHQYGEILRPLVARETRHAMT